MAKLQTRYPPRSRLNHRVFVATGAQQVNLQRQMAAAEQWITDELNKLQAEGHTVIGDSVLINCRTQKETK